MINITSKLQNVFNDKYMYRERKLHLKLRVGRTLVPQICHHRGQHSVAGRLARPRGPHERGPEADVEDVEHLDNLAHEERHLCVHRVVCLQRRRWCAKKNSVSFYFSPYDNVSYIHVPVRHTLRRFTLVFYLFLFLECL